MQPEPDPIATHDQAQAEAKQKARVVGAYFVQLLAEGVGEWEAMKFTLAFQRRFIFPDVEAAAGDDDADI